MKRTHGTIISRVLFFVVAIFCGLAGATSYTVDSLTDTVAPDGCLTLREALNAANTNAAVNEAPAGKAQGDFDADGMVDISDFILLKTNYNKSLVIVP